MTKRVDRRAVLLAGLGVLAAPAVVRAAGSTSGTLNILGWSAYEHEPLFEAFTRETGIRVEFLPQADQDGMLAQARVSNENGDIDIAEPTVDRMTDWVEADILQPWEEGRASIDAYESSLIGNAGTVASEAVRYFLPAAWGSEALAFTPDAGIAGYGAASLADLFDARHAGKVTIQASSALAVAGRLLEAQGRLPRPWAECYADEATMRSLWDLAFEEARKARGNFARFWAGQPEAEAAFRDGGCTLGLTWDVTAMALRRSRADLRYLSPKEGAFAWMQGHFLLKNARNVDQAYEFARFVATPKGAALTAKVFSANPAVKGAVDLLDKPAAEFYRAAYPDDALARLWWWPAVPAWARGIANDYADRLKAV